MEILEKIQKLEEQIGELKRENKILKERLDARNEDFDYAIKYYNGELEKILKDLPDCVINIVEGTELLRL